MGRTFGSSEKKRLLVIEDNDSLCNSLKESLQSSGHDVELLFNGVDIPRKMERSSFHLVVLSLELPDKNSLYWIKWLKSYYPCIPVIITSKNITPESRLQNLESGARDYIIKPFLNEELLIKIKFFLGGNTYNTQQQSIIEIGDFSLDIANKQIIKHDEIIPLTQLECKILQLLHMNVGIPLDREDLMWQTMGVRYVHSNRSIDTHINRLRKKIEDIPSKPIYIRTLRGRGYCFHLPER